jgi:hypothetical protein
MCMHASLPHFSRAREHVRACVWHMRHARPHTHLVPLLGKVDLAQLRARAPEAQRLVLRWKGRWQRACEPPTREYCPAAQHWQGTGTGQRSTTYECAAWPKPGATRNTGTRRPASSGSCLTRCSTEMYEKYLEETWGTAEGTAGAARLSAHARTCFVPARVHSRTPSSNQAPHMHHGRARAHPTARAGPFPRSAPSEARQAAGRPSQPPHSRDASHRLEHPELLDGAILRAQQQNGTSSEPPRANPGPSVRRACPVQLKTPVPP